MVFEPRSVTLESGEPVWSTVEPHPSLEAFVVSHWTVSFGPGPHSLRVFPDACIDLTIELHACEPRLWITGARTEPEVLAREGPVSLLGTRMKPGAAALLLGQSVRDLAPHWQPLATWVPEADELARRIKSATALNARLALLEGFLVARLGKGTLDERLVTALRAAVEHGGDLKVPELARRAGASERTLERLFDESVGMSPKRFLRVLRFQQVFREKNREPDWAELAAELGYADQAHLARELRALFGATASALWGSRDQTR